MQFNIKHMIPVALVVALGISACGSDSDSAPKTVTQVVTVAQKPATEAQTEPQNDVNTVEVTTTPAESEAITEEDVKQVYDEFLKQAIRGDTDAACDLMTEEYQEQFVKDGNASTDVDLKGDDCQTVMHKSAAVLTAFYGSDPHISYSDFKADGDKASVVTVIGNSDPTTVRFVRDGDDVKMDADH